MFLLTDKMIRENRVIYSMLLGVTIALQFLAGQPQYVFYTMIALFLYFLFHIAYGRADGQGTSWIVRQSWFFVCAVLISIAVSAVQILPSLEMTRYSTRENLSYQWVSQFSFPPGHLITFLLPDFFGDMLKVPYWGRNYLWEMSAYIGIVPLILVILSVIRSERRVVSFFFWLAIVSLLLAFGKYTPLLKGLYSFVPGFHLFRGASKFIFLTALSLAVLSGFGADVLIKSCRDKGTRTVMLSTVGAALVFILLLLVTLDPEWFRMAINGSVLSGDFYTSPEPFMTNAFTQAAVDAFRGQAVRTVGLLLVTTLVVLLAQFRWLNRQILMLLLFALIVCDLFAFSSRYMISFESREAFGDSGATAFLQQNREPFRIMAPEAEANFGMANRVATVGGYDTIMLKRFSEYINLAQGKSPDEPDLSVNIAATNTLTDLLNMKYLLLGAKSTLIVGDSFRLVFNNGAAKIFENSHALPRAFVVHGARSASGRSAIFQELTKSDFDPWQYAIVEEELSGLSPGPTKRGALPTIVKYSAHKVLIDADLDRPGLLVLGDTYCPGWQAFVDGRETKIFPTNYVMRSVFLPAGKHRVEFRYAPYSFKIGAAISLVALCLLAAVFTWLRYGTEAGFLVAGRIKKHGSLT